MELFQVFYGIFAFIKVFLGIAVVVMDNDVGGNGVLFDFDVDDVDCGIG